MSASQTGQLNALWSAHLVQEFIHQGIDHFFLAPGARCTPLTLALARVEGAHIVRHYDERGLAFAALGYARASGKAGVVITTSGTAVANLLPAVIEAAQDGVPLIVCSADRPPELRDCGANQAIDQQKIFGDQVRWFCDLPCPCSEIAVGYVQSTAAQAVLRSDDGPVHLNCQFRAPFEPEQPIDWPETAGEWVRTRVMPAASTAFHVDNFPERGWILLGRGTANVEEVKQIAACLGWPVFGDVTAESRSLSLDLLLCSEGFRETCEPAMVVLTGRPFVSKAVQHYLEQRPQIQRLRFTDRACRENPGHQSERVVIGTFCMPFENPESPAAWLRCPSVFADECRASHEVLRRQLQPQLEIYGELAIAAELNALLPAEHALFLGNSLPIRIMDLVGTWESRRIGSNRGASGIDGLVASAAGFALAAGRTTLLIGDLSLLHDLNSLVLARDLIIVAINNDGGGIFHLLPLHDQASFEANFGTPHGMTFKAAAAQFGLNWQAVTTLDGFRTAYQAALATDGPSLIEVTTDRAETAKQLRALRAVLSGVTP